MCVPLILVKESKIIRKPPSVQMNIDPPVGFTGADLRLEKIDTHCGQLLGCSTHPIRLLARPARLPSCPTRPPVGPI